MAYGCAGGTTHTRDRYVPVWGTKQRQAVLPDALPPALPCKEGSARRSGPRFGGSGRPRSGLEHRGARQQSWRCAEKGLESAPPFPLKENAMRKPAISRVDTRPYLREGRSRSGLWGCYRGADGNPLVGRGADGNPLVGRGADEKPTGGLIQTRWRAIMAA